MTKQLSSAILYMSACWLFATTTVASPVNVQEQAQSEIYQVNVAIKAKLKNNLFAQLSDLSPRLHYPVFSTTPTDQGFRVVGYGTCFPVQTSKRDRTYFLTNKHVIDYGEGMLQECQRFFAAMRLYAERTAAFTDPESRYKDLMRIVNLSAKRNKINTIERSVYGATVDSIWDTYDNQLSIKADPKRTLLAKYTKLSGFSGSAAYFIHAPGAASNEPLEAVLYRAAKTASEPDLAILAVNAKNIPSLELETVSPTIHEPVLAAGYPVSQKGRAPITTYSPTFSGGKITAMVSGTVQFDAPVSKGDSGGPLINKRGKVIGVIVRRAGASGTDKFAGAIGAPTVRQFIPELFSNVLPLKSDNCRQ